MSQRPLAVTPVEVLQDVACIDFIHGAGLEGKVGDVRYDVRLQVLVDVDVLEVF